MANLTEAVRNACTELNENAMYKTICLMSNNNKSARFARAFYIGTFLFRPLQNNNVKRSKSRSVHDDNNFILFTNFNAAHISFILASYQVFYVLKE